MKNLKTMFLISYLLITFNFVHAAKYEIRDGSIVTAHRIIPQNENELTAIKPHYVASFLKAYEKFSAQSLNVEDKTKFLQASFHEDEQDIAQPWLQAIKIVDQNQNLVGYFSISDIDDMRSLNCDAAHEFAGLPEHSIYIRHLFTDLDYLRKGIAETMLTKILPDIAPTGQHFYLATRRVNQPAINLYQKFNFTESAVSLHGLSTQQYISLEKHVEEVAQ